MTRRRGRPANFGTNPAVTAPVTTARVGPLCWVYVDGAGRRCVLDYSDDPNPRIAWVLVAALRARTEINGGVRAAGTVKTHKTAIGRFLRVLAQDGEVGLGLADLGIGHLDRFEASFPEVGGSHAFGQTAIVVGLLRSARDDGLGGFNERFAERLSFNTRVHQRQGQPVDAFDDFTAAQLTAAARADLNAAIERRRVGEAVLAGGSCGDPHVDRCVRWLAEHNWHTTVADARATGQLGDADTRGRWGRATKLVHLDAGEAAAFVVLFGLLTGLEPEVVAALTTADIPTAGRGRFTLTYNKARAGGPRTRSFRRGIVDDLATPGGALRVMAGLTAHTREATDDPSVLGYVAHTGLHQLRGGPVHQAIRRFLRRHDIHTGEGVPLSTLDRRQLRKTYYRIEYERHGGALPLLGHSRHIAARHYADTPANRPLHEETIERALTDALAVASPVVLRTRDLTGTAPGELAARLGATETTARTVIDGTADAFVASCLGPTASPFGPAGQLCAHSHDGSCFSCPNAVFTERTLPAVLLFKDHLDTERERWTEAEWQRRYQPTHHAVDACIAQFTPGEIEHARQTATASATGSDR